MIFRHVNVVKFGEVWLKDILPFFVPASNNRDRGELNYVDFFFLQLLNLTEFVHVQSLISLVIIFNVLLSLYRQKYSRWRFLSVEKLAWNLGSCRRVEELFYSFDFDLSSKRLIIASVLLTLKILSIPFEKKVQVCLLTWQLLFFFILFASQTFLLWSYLLTVWTSSEMIIHKLRIINLKFRSWCLRV
jgi:hypothetical protein